MEVAEKAEERANNMGPRLERPCTDNPKAIGWSKARVLRAVLSLDLIGFILGLLYDMSAVG